MSGFLMPCREGVKGGPYQEFYAGLGDITCMPLCTLHLSISSYCSTSYEYYVQLRSQCKGKRKLVGDKKCDSET